MEVLPRTQPMPLTRQLITVLVVATAAAARSGISFRKPLVPISKCNMIGIAKTTKSQPKKVKDIFPLPNSS
jgi:hypothetical protein